MEFSLSGGSEDHEDEKVIDSSESSRWIVSIPSSRDVHGAAKRMLFERLGVDRCFPHDKLTSPFSLFFRFLRNYATYVIYVSPSSKPQLAMTQGAWL